MYSYPVHWKCVLCTPALLGLLAGCLMLTGYLWHWWPLTVGGTMVLWVAIYLYVHRPWEQGDFISFADSYLLVCRRRKEYVFHASNIMEIVYGSNIKFKFQKQWFNLNCFVPCKQFQNDLVRFAVRNGIFVHASGAKGQEHGKYARLRIAKR